MIIGLETQFLAFLKVAVLYRFYPFNNIFNVICITNISRCMHVMR